MYNKIFQKIIFPIAELASGTTIQKKLKFLLKSQYWSRKKIEEYQNKRLKELMEHAYTNVPYYTRLFDKLGLKPSDIKTKKDLKKLPVLTKEIIRDNYNDLLVADYKKRSYGSKTSGSTGTPIEFRLTKEDFSWFWAAHLRAWQWAGYDLGDKHIRVIQRPRDKLFKNIQDRLMRCRFFSPGSMDETKINEFIQKINEFDPKMIYVYASTASVVGEYLLTKRMSLNIPITITTADNLTPKNKKIIEMAFNTKVYDDYGCGGEGLKVASQCAKGHYHVTDESMILEYMKNEMTITSLNNYAMPLIRYQPGDIVTPSSGMCKCGRKLSMIKSVDGRSSDYILTYSGEKLFAQFFGRNLMYHIPTINQYKIIQKKIDEIEIIMVVDKKHNRKDAENKIAEYISTHTTVKFRIFFKYVDSIYPDKNGKIRIIENRIK